MPKILVVEDDPLVQELCKAVLSREGFEPITASNGIEGLETYRAKQEEISLILSDIIMPHMSGLEMVRRIFSNPCQASVIIMSGTPLSDMVPAEAARICAVLQKPFTNAQLLQTVNRCLRPGRGPNLSDG